MKFAHEFQKALLKEGFPPHWVESAVPYSQLKKVIKKVKKELESIGLNPADLAGDGVAFQYKFNGDKEFRPKLTLTYNGELSMTDATLSSDTRNYLVALVNKRRKEADKQQSAASEDGSSINGSILQVSDSVPISHSVQRAGTRNGLEPTNDLARPESTVLQDGSSSLSEFQIRRIDIPLEFDTEFFGLLQDDVTSLDELQVEEQRAMTEQITELSKEMARLAAPSKFAKTDMYRWRALFDVYLQACIFFSTKEQDHGSRNSATAAQQLGWFQGEVTRQGLVDAFKLPASRQAFARFVTINITLLQNLKFQEINQKAIGKILKRLQALKWIHD